MILNAKDGYKIHIHCWEDVKKPRAVLQIFHGMSEHAGRYERFAKYLNAQGIVVYADDHRGHGVTADLNDGQGYLGEDGFNRIVADEYMLTEYVKQKYPQLPVIIFAHSFGSFIAQEYLIQHSKDISGIILCGSAAQTGFKFRMAKSIAKIYSTILGEKREAKFLDKLSFGSYNKRIKDADTFSWLSRDPEEVLKYNNDPKCGFICTANFYYNFCKGLVDLYQNDKLDRISKEIPIYIIAGKEDPVGEYGKRVILLEKLYRKKGIRNVDISIYEGARHELLNETNRDEVTKDILKWMEQNVKLQGE
jgi:alpha-beta hydrolase superfamily lysophospholipase